MPSVWDAASARAARSAGARALFLSGSALAASFGFPDIGLVPPDDLLRTAGRILEAAELPLLVDAECGFGDGSRLATYACALHDAGVRGILLEDQEYTGQSIAVGTPGLCDPTVMVDRIRRVQDATGGQLGVLARTDLVGASGEIGDSLERLTRYREAGADWLTAVFVRSRDELAACANIAPERFVAIAVPGTTGYVPDPADAFAVGCVGTIITGFLQAVFPRLQNLYETALRGDTPALRAVQLSRTDFADEMGFERYGRPPLAEG
jgi:2-methylisocitrate lyase-like PEP mutase family enzyme